MEETVVAGKVDDLEPGRMRRIEPDGAPAIAVYNIDGRLYATADRCTHAKASLSDGELDGDCVACPVHFGLFHVPTGKAVCFPVTQDLATYPVEVVEGEIHVHLRAAVQVTA